MVLVWWEVGRWGKKVVMMETTELTMGVAEIYQVRRLLLRIDLGRKTIDFEGTETRQKLRQGRNLEMSKVVKWRRETRDRRCVIPKTCVQPRVSGWQVTRADALCLGRCGGLPMWDGGPSDKKKMPPRG